MIDHEDLDRVAAEALVHSGVAAVINAAPSITGRYPNLGPMILEEAGVPLVDRVVARPRQGRGRGGRPAGGRPALRRRAARRRRRPAGPGLDPEDMDAAREAVDERFEGFARNTLEYMREERDLLFGGAGLPALSHTVAGRHVLVVVRGYGYREDLAALRSYIRDVKPLMGVDGGADALLDAGYTPDVVIGDMDSISDRALALISGRRGGRTRRRAARVSRTDALRVARGWSGSGSRTSEVRSAGTSEDIAFLLAHERRAELIVAVGTHGNLRVPRQGATRHVLDLPGPAPGGGDPDGRERCRSSVPEPGTTRRRAVARRRRARDVRADARGVAVAPPVSRPDGRGLDQVAAVISWRYHVVSIVAVVLAFGLGILAGSSVVGDELVKQLRRNTEEARRERDEALAMVEQHTAFAEGLQPTLRDGVLTGEEAIVVTMGGVDEPARATVEELTAAGVEVLATLELDPRLSRTRRPLRTWSRWRRSSVSSGRIRTRSPGGWRTRWPSASRRDPRRARRTSSAR